LPFKNSDITCKIIQLLNVQLIKWAVILKQYDLVYVPLSSVKGQAMTDFLADHQILDD